MVTPVDVRDDVLAPATSCWPAKAVGAKNASAGPKQEKSNTNERCVWFMHTTLSHTGPNHEIGPTVSRLGRISCTTRYLQCAVLPRYPRDRRLPTAPVQTGGSQEGSKRGHGRVRVRLQCPVVLLANAIRRKPS